MLPMEDVLKSNINEYFRQAKIAERDRAYNSAVVLYFKAIASLVDLLIYTKEFIAPSNHTERFRILKKRYMDIHSIVDKDFQIYQQSYRIKLTQEHVEVMKNDIKKIEDLAGIEIDFEG